MGWKNVKEHYQIGHIVCVTSKGLCIGSPYVHDLLCIKDAESPQDFEDTIDRQCTSLGNGLQVWRPKHLGRGQPFDGWVEAMQDDPAKLRELIDTPDTFERSLTVYTCDYYLGTIIEKQCEEYGWPNVTHDGDLMYDNSFSANRSEVVAYAKRNATTDLKSLDRRVGKIEKNLVEIRRRRDQFATALKKLECET